MPSRELLQNILATAVYAPSGDNAQPWEFEIKNDELYIFNKPGSDGTLYNFKERGSYVGHGAVVENIVLLALRAGYVASVEPFPGLSNCTAKISFIKTPAVSEPLCDEIKKRTTNRKPYDAIPLQPAHRAALTEAIKAYPTINLTLIEDKETVQKVSEILSLNERIMMENRTIHDFLFNIIRWSSEEEKKCAGLNVLTMELPPPVRFLFKYVLCHWELVRILNFFGFSKLIPLQTRDLYASSSAIGIFTIPSEDDALYLATGRALQKLWLTATSLGISVQIVTAIPYLAQRVRANEASALSDKHIDAIKKAEQQLCTLANNPKGYTSLIFRAGYGEAPTASSTKREPVLRSFE